MKKYDELEEFISHYLGTKLTEERAKNLREIADAIFKEGWEAKREQVFKGINSMIGIRR